MLSAKSGIAKFSGSFLSIHYFHYYSLRVIKSGSSLKKGTVYPEKVCFDRAKIFNHYLSFR